MGRNPFGTDRREIAELYDGVQMPAATERTPTTPDALADQAAAAARDGFVVSHGYLAPDGASIGAAIRDRSGATVAAIDISGPRSAFREGPLETAYLPRVREAAARISEKLGHRPV